MLNHYLTVSIVLVSIAPASTSFALFYDKFLCRGGPDPSGYVFIDSNEPDGPRFSWVDIRDRGTFLFVGDDQVVGPFPLGFSFPYYGNLYDSIWICSNGWASFVRQTGFSPRCALWMYNTDLNPIAPGRRDTIHYYRDTTNAQFLIQFTDVRHTSLCGRYTFQALIRSNGDIIFQYLRMIGCTDGIIGITNCTPEGNLLYNCPVGDSLAILFFREDSIMSVEKMTRQTSVNLYQNFPNPYNSSTKIGFVLQIPSFTSLKVYNVLGQEVAIVVDGKLDAGMYEAKFDGTNHPSGLYFYRLTTPHFTQVRKMLLLK